MIDKSWYATLQSYGCESATCTSGAGNINFFVQAQVMIRGNDRLVFLATFVNSDSDTQRKYEV